MNNSAIGPFFLLVFLLCSADTFSQKITLKNNLARGTLKTPNLSLEFSVGRKWTLDTQVGMNFFFYIRGAMPSRYKIEKFSHWLVQSELRCRTCDAFDGWFLGLHAHDGQMDIGGVNASFVLQKGDGDMKDHRCEGYFRGDGSSAGCQWMLSSYFNIEASLGIDYVHACYGKYKCTIYGQRLGKGDVGYTDPTGTAISTIHMLK